MELRPTDDGGTWKGRGRGLCHGQMSKDLCKYDVKEGLEEEVVDALPCRVSGKMSSAVWP